MVSWQHVMQGLVQWKLSAHLGAIVANVFVEQALGLLFLCSGRVKQIARFQRSSADGALRPPLDCSAQKALFLDMTQRS